MGDGCISSLGLTQHAGLGEDTYDHRENTRTVRVNPVYRYLYMNMNYHIEHHSVPMVPYHALAKLHAAVAGPDAARLPEPVGSVPGNDSGSHQGRLPAIRTIRSCGPFPGIRKRWP